MSASPNLQLPYLDANQNQKTVTHNQALRMLDALVQLGVQSSALQAPPAAPADGLCWIVAPGGTGAWAGKDLNVAAWQDGAWSFYAPRRGTLAFDAGQNTLVVWTGAAWTPLPALLRMLGVAALGIGTAPDSANPLSATLNGALFDALGASAGGTGDVRVKLNKAAAGATASFLFQDGFSGRAEIGLAGDDDFHLKVSADGSRFVDAMVVAGAGGAVSFLVTPTAPTPAKGDASTRLATTAFVAAAVDAGGHAGAGFARSQVVDAAYAVLATDRIVAVIALTAARTLTLPAAGAYPAGATLTVVDESGACSATLALTVAASGGDRINGAASAVIAAPYGYLALESNAANKWTIVDAPAPVTSVAGRAGAVTLAAADVSGAAPLASPALTGTPTAPNAPAGTNSAQLATTSFVAANFVTYAYAGANYATAADATLTGTPTAPTQAAGDYSARLATTAYVDRAAATVPVLGTAGVYLGAQAGHAGRFVLTDARITPTSRLAVWLGPGPYAGKGSLPDEAQMYPGLTFAAAAAAGQANVVWSAPRGGAVRGAVTLVYIIG